MVSRIFESFVDMPAVISAAELFKKWYETFSGQRLKSRYVVKVVSKGRQ